MEIWVCRAAMEEATEMARSVASQTDRNEVSDEKAMEAVSCLFLLGTSSNFRSYCETAKKPALLAASLSMINACQSYMHGRGSLRERR